MSKGGKALGVVYSDQDFDNVTVAEALTVVDLTVTGTQTGGGTSSLDTIEVTTSASIGAASTATLGFYGATVTTQPAAISAVTTATLTSVTTTAASSTTPYGYTTSTQ